MEADITTPPAVVAAEMIRVDAALDRVLLPPSRSATPCCGSPSLSSAHRSGASGSSTRCGKPRRAPAEKRAGRKHRTGDARRLRRRRGRSGGDRTARAGDDQRTGKTGTYSRLPAPPTPNGSSPRTSATSLPTAVSLPASKPFTPTSSYSTSTISPRRQSRRRSSNKRQTSIALAAEQLLDAFATAGAPRFAETIRAQS